MKKIFKCALCALTILSLAGCGEVPKMKDGTDTLVSFENEDFNISINDLYNKLKDAYGTSYLVEMMDEKILNNEYPDEKNPADSYIENQISMYEMYYGGEEGLTEAIKNSEYQTLDKFKEKLKLDYKRELATKDYVKNDITEKDIEKYYNNNIFGDITASHILIKMGDTSKMTSEEKRTTEEAAEKKIDEILEKLKNGTDFHEVAKEYSEDTATAKNGGKLDPFNFGEMESSFESAAKKLKVGEYTKTAVTTSYGYHIIYKEDQKEMPKLETVKQTIIDKITEEKISNDSKIQYKALIALREKYGIKINDENLSSNYENAINNWLYSKDED